MNFFRSIFILLIFFTTQTFAQELEIVLTYPKVIPKNDAEKAIMAYRDDNMALYNQMVKKYGPNIKSDGFICICVLAMAAKKNDVSEIQRLISLGGDVSICDNKPIFDAVTQNRFEATQTLIKAGAPINVTDKFGKTPLETALRWFPIFSNYNPKTSKDHVETTIKIIQLLVDNGADVTLKTKKGLSYTEFFTQKFANKKFHPDYKNYKKRVLNIIKPNLGHL